ncbi:lipid-A-disaccharide synthase [Candidatus Entotheonella palauensis]|uniref:lipid-A-disaccharide synthase n=1 Tax=Candidatus Entotheonella palauensis TaxID=93172 RepID=UPI0015C49942|nr:lipid-A-disaccharide synthase [Candidatus Entotheonella palauensis]
MLGGEISASLLVVAGEASGDQLGAALVRALLVDLPKVEVYGVGGEHMRAAGVETVFDVRDLNAVGAVEVVAKIPQGLRMAYRLLREAKQRQTRVVVLIDTPGFNLSFAALAKRAGLCVVFYVSPQIWAWRQGRVKKIRRRVDHMLTLFPFEVPFYTQAGVKATYVGHPLVDRVAALPSPEQAAAQLGLDASRPTVALLPGSRSQEIHHLLPPMLGALACMQQQVKSLQAALPVAPTIDQIEIERLLADSPVPVALVPGQSLEVLRASQVALVTSGTATLEAGLVGTPMVIVYQVHALTAFLVRLLIRVPYIGLVNIVAEKRVVPEFVQDEVQPQTLATAALHYLLDAKVRADVQHELAQLHHKMGPGDGAKRAAACVAACLTEIKAEEAPVPGR